MLEKKKWIDAVRKLFCNEQWLIESFEAKSVCFSSYFIFLRTTKLISFRRKSFLLGCRRLSTFSIIDFFSISQLEKRVSGFASPGNGNGRSRFPFSLQRSNFIRFQSLRRRQKWVPSERTNKRRRLELPSKKYFAEQTIAVVNNFSVTPFDEDSLWQQSSRAH